MASSGVRYLYKDRLGSVTAWANGAGAVQATFAYGPYGEPKSWGGTRFGYTGQVALSELGLYHYHARVYDPAMGRFLQPDPIGYGDGPNLYLYAHGDPINGIDPLGLMEEVVVTARRRSPPPRPLPSAGRTSWADLNASASALAGWRAMLDAMARDISNTQAPKGGQAEKSCPAGTVDIASIQAGLSKAAADVSAPTVAKPGAIAGGGKSGPWTSQASRDLRIMTGRARFGPLRVVTGTSSIGGSIGRALPGWGTMLLFFDFVQLRNTQIEQEGSDDSGCISIA